MGYLQLFEYIGRFLLRYKDTLGVTHKEKLFFQLYLIAERGIFILSQELRYSDISWELLNIWYR